MNFDICQLMGEMNKLHKVINIISLLQPPSETFLQFDMLILFSQGQVIYSGPIKKVVPHFKSPKSVLFSDFQSGWMSQIGCRYVQPSIPKK
jgi:ABC-type multidrug transport system ATPase subunit